MCSFVDGNIDESTIEHRHIEVVLKQNNERITFNGLCNKTDYSNNKFCIFRHDYEKDESYIVLAMIPYDNILYIDYCPYTLD